MGPLDICYLMKVVFIKNEDDRKYRSLLILYSFYERYQNLETDR